jgi:hypothetical protein
MTKATKFSFARETRTVGREDSDRAMSVNLQAIAVVEGATGPPTDALVSRHRISLMFDFILAEFSKAQYYSSTEQ